MAEALAVLGAVSATVGLMNSARGVISYLKRLKDDSGKATELFANYELDLEICEISLKSWHDIWQLNTIESSEILVATKFTERNWGTEATRTILDLLTRIDVLTTKVHNGMASFILEVENTRGGDDWKRCREFISRKSNNTTISKRDRIEAFEAWMDVARTTTRLEFRVDIAVFHEERLKKPLEQLDENINKLFRLSSRVAKARAEASTNQQKADESVITVVLSARRATEGCAVLWNSASRSFQGNMELGIGLGMYTSLAPDTLRFQHHLLVPLGRGAKPAQEELLVSYVPLTGSPEDHELHDSFREACQCCHTHGRCLLVVDDRTIPFKFQLRQLAAPMQRILAQNQIRHKLVDGIHHRDFNVKRHFRLRERYELAHSVLYCGFLMLGTEWLGRLGIGSLIRIQDRRSATVRYIIQVYGEMSQVRTTLVESGKAIEPHTFSIGVLLAEIALVTTIKDIEIRNSRSVRFKLRDKSQRENDWSFISLDDLLDKVETAIGLPYMRIVEACLYDWDRVHQYRTARKNGHLEHYYQKILIEEYYKNIWKPFQQLVGDSLQNEFSSDPSRSWERLVQ